MSGDRLAQIEERVRTRAVRTGNNWAPLSNADVLALVEIAKATRVIVDAADDPGLEHEEWKHIHIEHIAAARSALARLDSGGGAK